MTLKTILAAAALLATTSLALAADHTVTITGFSFQPANLTIAAGDTVTFVNKDGAPHTATAKRGGFDTGNLSRGKAAKITFASAGSFAYFCKIHPSMTGSIKVN
ncbi:cupredoxin family copper-binding protein [uncultured Litoreibacter sp.]|uniref:cupredoxin domain-containing protein n=1 Tax=uncultured Litoreibacter sp. TaxID=1392394 RepID=UPI00263367AF|nr:cupredoxin family copper-binding protein [uncultured Litoreibacter sp.]